MNTGKSLSNITYFDDGLGSHIENGEVDCEVLFVNGVRITTNGGGGGSSIPSISYSAGPPSVTTITGNTILQNLNGFTSANLTNALNQTVSLTSPAQAQINIVTTKTTNQSFAGNNTSFTGTVTLNSNTTLVTNRTMTVNGAISVGVNGTIISNGVTLTNTQIGFLGGATANLQNQISTLQNKTTNQFYNSSLDRTQITGITLLENLNLSGTINSRLINVGTSVSPSLINLNGDLSIPSASTITANGVVLTATELSYIDGASSNIQTQINNVNSAISSNDTDITNIQDDIADINTHLGSLDAGLGTVGAALAATDLVVASNTTAITAIAAEQIIQNGYISDHSTNLNTLNFKTTRQSFATGAGGVPDTTTFNSNLVCNQLLSNTISPEAGNSLLFAISATGTFQNNLEVQGSFNQTGTVGTIANSFGGQTTFNNTTNFNGNTKFNTSASNPTAIFDTPVSLNAVTSFNGKSTTFYEENPPFPAQTKAIVTFNQPTLFYKPIEIYENVTMEQNRTLFCNKIIANPLMVGVDTLTIGSAAAVNTENFKISSNIELDPIYTFTLNGRMNGATLNFGTQAVCSNCEIATNTGITLRTSTLNVIANTTNISNNALFGDPTQTTSTTLTSYGQFALKSGLTLYESVTSTFKDAIIYAEKLAGATTDFIGTLNLVARRFIYTNINEIFYRTSFATGFNDVAITITPVYGIQHGGSYKVQSSIQDLEAPIIYIGKDVNSVINCRGTLFCESIQSNDGRIDMPDDIFAQF